MANKEHCAAVPPRNFVHLSKAFSLEFRIADGQYLIDDQDLRFQMRGHSECEPDLHARGEALYRSIQKLLHSGKGDNLVKLLRDLASCHPKDRAVQKDVFAAGQLRMQAR